MSRPILEVSGYTLGYRTRGAARRILDDVSLQIAPGEVLGLVGESGSGKTSFALAVMRALPRNAVESGGPIALAGQNLRAMTPKAATAIRGREIAMVFQDPSTSLNPTLTLGRQVTEVLRRHRALPAEAAHDEAMAILRHVGLRDRAGLMRRYPHQVSGGEKQRVMIATAFATRPDLILFDEPTTALDVITGARVLELFAALRAESGVAALYISHDLALVARVADRVAVLDRSRIVEQAAASAIFTSPQADYTRRLVAAVPRPGRRLPTGTPTSGSILEFDRMTVTYATKRLFRPAPAPNVQGISFTIRPGEILGLVGESGSGKSTVTRAATGLVRFQMRALGLEADLTPVPGDRVNAVGRLKGIDGGASLLFNGHVDTNPVTEGWTVDPWGGLVDDRFIYGIGVSNMKAGDAAYFCAVRTLVEAGVKLKGDVILTFVVGELQGGVGTKALMDQGLRADYFVNAEPTDLEAMTMHAAAFTFIIELIGQTRHLSKREEAVDAIVAACDVIPRLNAMRFTDAPTPEHASINRVHVGVMHGALGRALTEWRPAQVADYVRLQGSGRYAPGQTEAHALEDMRRELMPWRPASPA